MKVCSSLLQPSCFLRPISWLTKSRPLPEQMFSPADLEVLQDLSARSQSGFWRAVGWLKRVWTPRRRFLGAWVNSSCGWWWREAVQRAFFFFLPATAFSLWKDGSGEWSQWPWRARTHWHAPGRKHNTHPLIENQRDSYTCTHTHSPGNRDGTHTRIQPPDGKQHRHLAGIEALICLHTSPSLRSSSTQPQSRL